MMVTRMIGFWAALVLLVGACGLAAWWLRRSKRVVGVVFLGCAVFAVLLGTVGWSWANALALPQYIDYVGGQWYSESPQQPLVSDCESASQMQRRGAWPLRSVGRITWVSPDSVGGLSVSGRGYRVYSHLPSEIFVEVRPGCYSAYTAV